MKSLHHWGWVMHIWISKLTVIGSDNGFYPHQHQAIIWTIAGILLICPLGTKFSEISIKVLTFSFKKMLLKMLSVKWQPFCLSPSVLKIKHVYSKSNQYHIPKEWEATMVSLSNCPSATTCLHLCDIRFQVVIPKLRIGSFPNLVNPWVVTRPWIHDLFEDKSWRGKSRDGKLCHILSFLVSCFALCICNTFMWYKCILIVCCSAGEYLKLS